MPVLLLFHPPSSRIDGEKKNADVSICFSMALCFPHVLWPSSSSVALPCSVCCLFHNETSQQTLSCKTSRGVKIDQPIVTIVKKDGDGAAESFVALGDSKAIPCERSVALA